MSGNRDWNSGGAVCTNDRETGVVDGAHSPDKRLWIVGKRRGMGY